MLAPLLKEQPDPNVEVRLPEEVPDWVAEGLAAGPPLDDPPPPAAANPPLRQKTRPEESEGTWIAAVQRMAIPSDAALARAIDGRDTAALRTVAGLLVRFSEQLRAEPDPKGGRETSARVRLSLLVDADAARAAQVAALEGDGDAAARLSRTARRLALNLRHVQAIEHALESLGRAAELAGGAVELCAAELRDALDALGQVLGHVSPDDLIGRIFSQFCIGK